MDTTMDNPSFDLQVTHISFEVNFIIVINLNILLVGFFVGATMVI